VAEEREDKELCGCQWRAFAPTRPARFRAPAPCPFGRHNYNTPTWLNCCNSVATALNSHLLSFLRHQQPKTLGIIYLYQPAPPVQRGGRLLLGWLHPRCSAMCARLIQRQLARCPSCHPNPTGLSALSFFSSSFSRSLAPRPHTRTAAVPYSRCRYPLWSLCMRRCTHFINVCNHTEDAYERLVPTLTSAASTGPSSHNTNCTFFVHPDRLHPARHSSHEAQHRPLECCDQISSRRVAA